MTVATKRAGKVWSAKEDNLLVQRIALGLTLEKLAKEHKRTEGAIQSRVCLMNWCRHQCKGNALVIRRTTMTKHKELDATEEQRANLDTLATYLEALPEEYDHFDMRRYFDARGLTPDIVALSSGLVGTEHLNVCGTVALSSGRCTAEDLNVCGTVACAIGHGPAAGVAPQGGEGWSDYTIRAFGDGENDTSDRDTRVGVYTWAFHEAWAHYDNTPLGAAQRIRYALKHGVPILWDYTSAVELYQENET